VGGRVVPIGNNETASSSVPDKYNTIGKVFDNGFVSNNYDTEIKNQVEVDTLIGCNMSFRKKLLIKSGGFDENFRGSCFRDDTDMSTRIKRLNYKLAYNPRALVWHKYKGKSINHKWFYWYAYNHFYFCFKNFQPINAMKFMYLLKGAFIPPRGYLRKAGIRVKPDPLAALCVLSGIIDANKVYKSNHHKK
jgi:GT2 family glycosyltransferase